MDLCFFLEILSVYCEETLIHCRENSPLFNVFLKLLNDAVGVFNAIREYTK
jgi:hypothetical protein